MALFCVTNKRDSVSFLRFPCFWSCPNLLVCNLPSLLLEVFIELFSSHLCFLVFVVFLLGFMLSLLLLVAVIRMRSFQSILGRVQSILGEWLSVYSFDDISVAELGFEKFSRLSEVFFSFFSFHFCLFNVVNFQYFQVLVIFFL